MKNQPVYSIASVDHALHLAVLLQQEGPLRVADVAERLGVARSTAHRLLGVLVYRDFAEQGPDRLYRAGPVLRRLTGPEPVDELRKAALPHLQRLTAATNETSNVMVVVEDQTRFVATVECSQILRVGDREGRVLPAHASSGGRAVLATRSDAEVMALYGVPDSPVPDVERLLRDLRKIRRQGFAVNDQATETGLIAIGCRVPGPPAELATAVSLAMPRVRYRRERLPEWAGQVNAAAQRISRDLHAFDGFHGAVR